MAASSAESVANSDLFQRLDEYPWDSDDEFQHGLQAILGQSPSPEQIQYLTLKARCFYFSRKYSTAIDFPAYQAWHSTNGANESKGGEGAPDTEVAGAASPSEHAGKAQGSAGEKPKDQSPPYPLSFNQIVELITTGQPIPGIKEIPDTVLEGQASESKSAGRKKPWES